MLYKLILSVVLLFGTTSAYADLPEFPRVYVDTTMPSTSATKTVCASGCNYTNSQLQAALNAANLGDVIELQAGATYPGKITLPNKTSGTGWIIVRSSAWQNLPPPGTRVGPQHAPLMAKITTNPSALYDYAVVTNEGAHHYRFIGIEVTGANPPGQQYALFIIDGSHYDENNVFKLQPNNALTPHHIVIDRCYIHGTPTGEFIRGVLIDGLHVAIVDSYLSDFHSRGADTQAAVAWNTAGPLKLVNNYLEAAGENVMFGGAASATSSYVPSDIEIRNNFFDKPLSWRPGDPAYAGITWVVKNLLEFKDGQRALIEGNIFGHHWAGAQSGFFFLITPRGEDNQNPWAFTGDITFRYNIILKTTGGPAVGGTDGQVTQKSNRVLFEHNVFENLGAYVVPGAFNGEFTMIGNAIQNLTIRHNTIFQSSTPFHFVGDAAGPMNGLTVVDNIFANGGGGIVGESGVGYGVPELNAVAPGWVMRKNAIYGPFPNQYGITGGYYPPDNYIPASQNIVGFVNLAGGDYHLAASSYYKNGATDGKDPGADIDAVNRATACVMSGACGVSAPIPTVPAPLPTAPAPTTTASAPTTTVPASTNTAPAPTTTVSALKPPAPAPMTAAPAPTTTVPALKPPAPAPTPTVPAQRTTAQASMTTASAPTSTASAPTSTVPDPTTTVPVPTPPVPAPMTTAPAPTTTVPAPMTTAPAPTPPAPAPMTTASASTTTTPAPSLISSAPAPTTSAVPSGNSAKPECSQKQTRRWWQIWRWFQKDRRCPNSVMALP